MLAFLHAQSVARPLKQAVVGLDFFGFNIFFPRAREQQQARFRATAPARSPVFSRPSSPRGHPASAWRRAPIRTCNTTAHTARCRTAPIPSPGAAGIAPTGRLLPTGTSRGYLQVNPDAASRIAQGAFASGYQHYLAVGRFKGLLGGFQPADWNEAGYLATNPEAGIEIALGAFRTGYLHYAAVGQARGLAGGLPPPTRRNGCGCAGRSWTGRCSRSTTCSPWSSPARPDASLHRPAAIDAGAVRHSGVRLFGGQEETLRRLGGVGHLIRSGSAAVHGVPGSSCPGSCTASPTRTPA